MVLAGAFGTHIDPKYAMVLGMVPDCLLDNVVAAGNSAGAGARMALLNTGAREVIEQTVRQIEKIETAVEADFQIILCGPWPSRIKQIPIQSSARRSACRNVV